MAVSYGMLRTCYGNAFRNCVLMASSNITNDTVPVKCNITLARNFSLCKIIIRLSNEWAKWELRKYLTQYAKFA